MEKAAMMATAVAVRVNVVVVNVVVATVAAFCINQSATRTDRKKLLHGRGCTIQQSHSCSPCATPFSSLC